MSGQTSVAFEQTQPVDAVEFADVTPNSNEVNAIASFLEKYGSTMMQNHEGQMVTVAEAMANCPPFARLVEAMGEGALSLTAAQRHEEKEGETEAIETEEESSEKENNPESKEEAKEPKKNSDSGQPEKDLATRQDGQKVEQSHAAATHEPEVAATSDIAAQTQAADNITPIDNGASQLSAAETSPQEKTAQPSFQQPRPVESPATIEAQATGGGNGYFVEAPHISRGSSVASEAPVAPPAPAEIQSHLKRAKEVAGPSEIIVPEAVETVELGIRLNETLQNDELYQPSDLAIDLEIGGGYLLEDGELTFQLPADEQWQPTAELVEQELPVERTNENFSIPIQEVPLSNVAEYSQKSPESITELSMPVEELEQTIPQIADSIQKMEAEEAEMAHQILDEIFHKIAETQTPVESGPEVAMETNDEDLEEELKELFIQLFDRVEIEYSPELIESCVRLALQGDISHLIARVEQDEEVDDPQDRGTHEVIKQLLAAISSFKKSVQHVYQIGKSALQLYSQQLALV